MDGKHMKETDRQIVSGIVAEIDEIIALGQSPAKSAPGIVAATWCHDIFIMKFEKEYPELIVIADIASDLELPQKDAVYVAELWDALLANMSRLKKRL